MSILSRERVGPVALMFLLVLGSKQLAPETYSFPSSITKVIEIYILRSIVDQDKFMVYLIHDTDIP